MPLDRRSGSTRSYSRAESGYFERQVETPESVYDPSANINKEAIQGGNKRKDQGKTEKL